MDKYTVVLVDNYEPLLLTNKGTYSLPEAVGVGVIELNDRKVALREDSEYMISRGKDPLYDDYKLSTIEYMEGDDNPYMNLLVKKHGESEYTVMHSVYFLVRHEKAEDEED